MARSPKVSSSYPLTQSPFYRLRSRKKLAALYDRPLEYIETLVARSDNYRVFVLKRGRSAKRRVEWPKPELERLHYRTLSLLQRIESPGYLHSGVRDRSYLTNALCHKGDFSTVKLDIRKFYPSTNGGHIYGGLTTQFACSSDVAAVITSMCTYEDHLPTGSCVSQALGFYSHKKMFDEIWGYCEARQFIMTCYVDDLTISGKNLGLGTVRAIGRIIRRRGLDFHKAHYFPAGKPKVITGVVIHGNAVKVPNKRQQVIHESLIDLRAQIPNQKLYRELDRLLGRANSAAEIEARYKAAAEEARAHLVMRRQ